MQPADTLNLVVARLNDLGMSPIAAIPLTPENVLEALQVLRPTAARNYDLDACNAFAAKYGAASTAPVVVEVKTAQPEAPVDTSPDALFRAFPFPPTADQKRALEKLVAWLATPVDEAPYFLLAGFAGTGKTSLVKLLTLLPYCFLYTAPTHKAARVLRDVLGATVNTLHSTLRLKLVEDPETSEQPKLVSTEPARFAAGSILVVDETSMVGEALLDITLEAVARNNCKLLLIGDPAQLPPVGEQRSPAWSLIKDSSCRVFLSETVRFDDQILTLSTDIRDGLRTRNYARPRIVTDHDGERGVLCLTESKFRARLLDHVKKDRLASAVVLAWRNVRVHDYNELIRAALGYADPYEVGERVLFARPLTVNGSIVAAVDDEAIVTKVSEGAVTVPLARTVELPVYHMMVEGDYTGAIVVPQSESEFQDVLSRLGSQCSKAAKAARTREARQAAWEPYWSLKNSLVRLRYGYAITCHRSQGSTYETVFVDRPDILLNTDDPTAFRCLYVAVTRASKEVIVL